MHAAKSYYFQNQSYCKIRLLDVNRREVIQVESRKLTRFMHKNCTDLTNRTFKMVINQKDVD